MTNSTKFAGIAAFLTLAFLPLRAQAGQNGNANVKGDCNITNTGNNDTLVIQGCAGLPKSVRDQITQILKNDAENRAEEEHRYQAILDRFGTIEQYFQEDKEKKQLLEEFPLGYQIFDVDHTNAVFPYPNEGLKDFDLDWSHAGILENTSDELVIRLPSVKSKDGTLWIRSVEMTWHAPDFSRFVGGAVFQLHDDEPWVYMAGRVLSKNESGTVFVVGFAPLNLPRPPMLQ